MGDWAAGTTLTIDEAQVALFAIAVSVLSGLLFGLAPVLQIVRADLVVALRGGAPTGRAGWRARHDLVVVQVALSVLLLAGASLLARTLFAVRAVELGFDSREMLLASVYLPRECLEAGDGERLYQELVTQVRQLPGVEAASLVRNVPMTLSFGTRAELAGVRAEINTNVVGERYFETLGVPLLEGRLFGSRDVGSAPPVVVLNRSAAGRYWPHRSPLGERLVLFEHGFEEPGQAYEVVGVVADSRYEPAFRPLEPLVYLPFSQRPSPRMTLLVRSRAPLAEPLGELLRSRYPDLAVIGLAPFEEQLRRGLANQAMNAELSTGLALLGLLIALVGIFSVMSYTVTQRHHCVEFFTA